LITQRGEKRSTSGTPIADSGRLSMLPGSFNARALIGQFWTS
jgi:hypothetical protein